VDEVARIKVIDKFVARTLMKTATYAATYPLDMAPTPKMLQAELKTAIASLVKHDKNEDDVFSASEQNSASKVAKTLVAFALQAVRKARNRGVGRIVPGRVLGHEKGPRSATLWNGVDPQTQRRAVSGSQAL
jgi:hypothetical protein